MPKLSLDVLAQRLKTAFKQLESNLRQSCRGAVEYGRILNKAKERCQHGEWTAWRSEHCQVSQQQASKWMRLAAAVDAGQITLGRSLSINEALRHLRADQKETSDAKSVEVTVPVQEAETIPFSGNVYVQEAPATARERALEEDLEAEEKVLEAESADPSDDEYDNDESGEWSHYAIKDAVKFAIEAVDFLSSTISRLESMNDEGMRSEIDQLATAFSAVERFVKQYQDPSTKGSEE